MSFFILSMDGVAENRVLDCKSHPPPYSEGTHWPFISTFQHGIEKFNAILNLDCFYFPKASWNFLSLVFWNLTVMCMGLGLFCPFFSQLVAPLLWKLMDFHSGQFVAFVGYFSPPCFLFLSSWNSYLPFLLSRKFPELYLSTYLLRFSCFPIIPF